MSETATKTVRALEVIRASDIQPGDWMYVHEHLRNVSEVQRWNVAHLDWQVLRIVLDGEQSIARFPDEWVERSKVIEAKVYPALPTTPPLGAIVEMCRKTSYCVCIEGHDGECVGPN